MVSTSETPSYIYLFTSCIQSANEMIVIMGLLFTLLQEFLSFSESC